MIADLSREKLTLQRSQNSVLLYGCFCISAINEASLLKTTVAVAIDPDPPVVEKTNGERNQTQFPECVVHMHVSFPVQHGGSTVVALGWSYMFSPHATINNLCQYSINKYSYNAPSTIQHNNLNIYSPFYRCMRDQNDFACIYEPAECANSKLCYIDYDPEAVNRKEDG